MSQYELLHSIWSNTKTHLSEDGKWSDGEECGEESAETIAQQATLDTTLELLSFDCDTRYLCRSSDVTRSFHHQRDCRVFRTYPQQTVRDYEL